MSSRAFSDGVQARRLERWRLALVAVFGYGTVVHLLQLVLSGGRPYPGLPGWLVTFFVSLTLLDPLIAVGLTARRRWSVWLALVVLALDAATNGYTLYILIPSEGVTAGRLGQGVITLLTFAVAVTAQALDRSFAASTSPGSR